MGEALIPNQKNISEGQQISLEEKNFVDKIEKLKTGYEAKIMIMLTWKELKSVSEFSFEKYDTENEPLRLEQIKETEKLFKDLKIFSYRIQKKLDGKRFDKEGNSKPMIFYQDNYYISKNKKDLDYFINHFGKNENYEITKKLGEILGYPKSAVEAWNAQDRSKTILDRDSELYNKDEMAFSNFRFSKANYEEEFKTVKKWAEAIKHLDPDLYHKVVRNYQEILKLNKKNG